MKTNSKPNSGRPTMAILGLCATGIVLAGVSIGQISRLGREKTALVDENVGLYANLGEKTVRIGSLEEIAAELKDSLLSARDANISLSQRVARLDTQIGDLELTLQNTINERDSIQASLNGQIDTLFDEKLVLNQRIAELNAEMNDHALSINRLTDELASARQAVVEMQERETELIAVNEMNEGQIAEISRQYNLSQQETEVLLGINICLEQEVASSQSKTLALEGDVASLMESVNAQSMQISNLGTALVEASSELEMTKGENDSLRGERVDLLAQVGSLREVIAGGELQTVAMADELADLRFERGDLRSEVSRLNETIGALRDENMVVMNNNRALATEFEKLEARMESMAAQFEESRSNLLLAQNEAAGLRAELAAVSSQAVAMNEEVNVVRLELAQSNEEKADLGRRVSDLNTSLVEERERYGALEDSVYDGDEAGDEPFLNEVELLARDEIETAPSNDEESPFEESDDSFVESDAFETAPATDEELPFEESEDSSVGGSEIETSGSVDEGLPVEGSADPFRASDESETSRSVDEELPIEENDGEDGEEQGDVDPGVVFPLVF